MRKLLIIFLICLSFTSCLTFNQLETVGDEKIVYNCTPKDLPESCCKFRIFSNYNFSKYTDDPNVSIAQVIKNNLDNFREVELPTNLKSKRYVYTYNQNTNIFQYYVKIHKNVYQLHEFEICIDDEKIALAREVSLKYADAVSSKNYYEDLYSDCVNPTCTRLRQVPRQETYTTTFRTAYGDDIVQYHTRTVYDLEPYTAPNPNYSPENAKKYYKLKVYWEQQKQKLSDSFWKINWYTVYYYNSSDK